MGNFEFAIGKKIMSVRADGELFDASYSDCDTQPFRIDVPLYFIMENGDILRLFGRAFWKLSEIHSFEIEQCEKMKNNETEVSKAFQLLCGKRILAVNYLFEPDCEIYDFEEKKEPIALEIVLDGKITLECSTFFGEYSDICILERL